MRPALWIGSSTRFSVIGEQVRRTRARWGRMGAQKGFGERLPGALVACGKPFHVAHQ